MFHDNAQQSVLIVEGIDSKDIDLKDLSKKLKDKFACGGTAKDGRIELQGNHTQKVKEVLVTLGFSPETIEIRKDDFKKRRY